MACFRLTAESATEGQPDKLADWVSDGVVDALLGEDAFARVHVETMITRGFVLVAGEVNTRAFVDIAKVVRASIAEAGYRGGPDGFDPQSCGVLSVIGEQSPEIAVAVDRKAAGDSCVVVGYATNEGDSLPGDFQAMPVPVVLAHRVACRLSEVRREGGIEGLTPDGECLLTVEYERGVPRRIPQATLSASHRPDADLAALREALVSRVLREVLDPTGLLDAQTELVVNPAGTFVHAGPQWDSGITGRKAVSDAYGSHARHGGSAPAGKDPTKIDRSAVYGARYVAKHVVAAGLADRCEVQLAYSLGKEDPVGVVVDTFETGKAPDSRIAQAVARVFDLTPAGFVDTFDLRRPMYRDLSVYGPFGRPDLPWEQCDRIEPLRRAVEAPGGRA